jgi:hypothetical protein
LAAPKNNKFWKQRSRHGREKLFVTPKLLLQAAEEYFAWCDNNPWMKIEQLKRPFEKIVKGKKTLITTAELPTQRPYTLSGFGLFCYASEKYLQEFERSLNSKSDPASQDFLAVITCIRETISTQQLEGATVGAFNANIIARKLGLTDKKDITTDGESLNKGYFEFLKQRKTKKPE